VASTLHRTPDEVSLLVPLVRKDGGAPSKGLLNGPFAGKPEQDIMPARRTPRHEPGAGPPTLQPIGLRRGIALCFEPEIDPFNAIVAARPGTRELVSVVYDMSRGMALITKAAVLGNAALGLVRAYRLRCFGGSTHGLSHASLLTYTLILSQR
jgi:hypothetical protein